MTRIKVRSLARRRCRRGGDEMPREKVSITVNRTCHRCGTTSTVTEEYDGFATTPTAPGWSTFNTRGRHVVLCVACLDLLDEWLDGAAVTHITGLADAVADMSEEDMRALVIAFTDTLARHAAGEEEER